MRISLVCLLFEAISKSDKEEIEKASCNIIAEETKKGNIEISKQLMMAIKGFTVDYSVFERPLTNIIVPSE